MIKKMMYVVLFLLIIAITLMFYTVLNFGASPNEQEQKNFERHSYYKDGKFQSPMKLGYYPEKVRNGPNGFWRFIDNSRFAPTDKIPVIELTKQSFPDNASDYSLYWLGHSSAIMDIDGKRYAFDPVIENAGPLPFIAPRFVKSPIKRDELPDFDYVIITHNHYDHLERKTVQAIKGHFIVPLGVGTTLKGWGIDENRITELGWGESFKKNGVKITATEGVHYSSRSPWDRDKTLWNSYVIKTENKNIFWCGDTGYSDHFKKIGEEFGPFDLAVLEIDGWNPAWPQTHLFPDEVIKAGNELKAKNILPVHWGVFELALHPWQESIEMVIKNNNGKMNILTPKMGEMIIPGYTETSYWWRGLK